jgi:hypothetical protein
VPSDDYVVSVGLKLTNSKTGKIVSVYQREIFKKILILGTFYTHSVIEGLRYNVPCWILNTISVCRNKFLLKV